MVLLLFNMIYSPPPPPPHHDPIFHHPYLCPISPSTHMPKVPKLVHAQESQISLLFSSFAFFKSPGNFLRVKAKF